MEGEKQYAFWKYDTPPYVLCGELLSVRDDGGIYVKGYDQNMTSYFAKDAVIAIVPYKKGLKLKKKVEKAKKKYDRKLKDIKSELLSVRDIIIEAGKEVKNDA